jgi:hypothetical protein
MEYKMADKKTYKTASGAQQYGSSEDFKKQGDAAFYRFLEDPVGNYEDSLIHSAMDAGEYGALAKEAKTLPAKNDLGDIEKHLAGFTKNRNNIKKAKEKPKAGPKGNVKKMAEGGKTGMRGQVKKDDMNKKAVNSAVKEAMDSIREGKINPPKEPDGGVARGSKKYQFGYGPDHPEAKSALAPKTSSRPKPRPEAKSALAPKTSFRPKPRPKSMEEDDYGAVDRGNRAAQLEGFNYGGKVSKMAMGGKCRGMGAATKGGSFSKNG